MDLRTWKDALLRLDVNRECTVAGTSEDSCWLCDSLQDWNCVLNALGLNLAEQQLGKLCLSTQAKEGAFDMGDAPFSTADFIAWLPRKHWCIETLQLFGKGSPSCLTVVVPDSVAGRPSKLRSVILDGDTYSKDWVVVLDALGPIQQLEELKVSTDFLGEDLALRLARLLATSAGSVTKVDLSGGHIWRDELDILMCGISKCHKLRELKFCSNFKLTGLTDCTNWLRSTETLETLCIVEDPDDPEDCFMDDDEMEIDIDENNEGVLAAVIDLLRKSTSLKELRYQLYSCFSLENAFKALETNTVLRRLVISGYHFDLFCNNSKMGVYVKSVLAKNEALRSLTFENGTMSVEMAILISEGLRENRTLEVLDVSACDLDFLGVQALCNALKQNTTLTALRVGRFTAFLDEREWLSSEARVNGWYKRVQMPWGDRDVPGLEASLGDPLQCPSDLCLCTDLFSDKSFSTLCTALSSSLHIQSLTVLLREVTPLHVQQLYEMLSTNRSLKCVVLEDGPGEPGCSVAVSHGLCFNSAVTELTVKCGAAETVCAEMFAALLKTNQTLSKVVMRCDCDMDADFVRSVSQGLLLNKVVTDFSILENGYNTDRSTTWTRMAVQRNRTCLYRAVRFVLRKNVGKECAEAFERFETKPSLVPCIMSASGMSRTEADGAVKAARQFIQANYLIISGVIQSNLECCAGIGTQIDQLNMDCWLVIAKYLKVSDVIERLEC